MVLSFLSGIIICLFPAKVRDINEIYVKEEDEVKADSNDNDISKSENKIDLGRLQDIPKALMHLLKNGTYMFITLGGTMDGFILAGNTEVQS